MLDHYQRDKIVEQQEDESVSLNLQHRIQEDGEKSEFKYETGMDLPQDLFEGTTFVITGAFEEVPRIKLENLVRECGGRVMSKVNGKTDYLVVGSKLGRPLKGQTNLDICKGKNYQLATKLNVKI